MLPQSQQIIDVLQLLFLPAPKNRQILAAMQFVLGRLEPKRKNACFCQWGLGSTQHWQVLNSIITWDHEWWTIGQGSISWKFGVDLTNFTMYY